MLPSKGKQFVLPFLKPRDEGVGRGPVEVKHRNPDDHAEFDLCDAIAEDMLMAFQNNDKRRLRGALEAFAEYIQDIDSQQDQTMMGEVP